MTNCLMISNAISIKLARNFSITPPKPKPCGVSFVKISDVANAGIKPSTMTINALCKIHAPKCFKNVIEIDLVS